MSFRRVLLFSLPAVLMLGVLPGCPGAQTARDDLERSKTESLAFQMQKVRKAMADEIAKSPGKAREIAAKYAKALQYLDEEAAKLPEPLRDELARKYAKK